jgi:chromosome segregation ATPase
MFDHNNDDDWGGGPYAEQIYQLQKQLRAAQAEITKLTGYVDTYESNAAKDATEIRYLKVDLDRYKMKLNSFIEAAVSYFEETESADPNDPDDAAFRDALDAAKKP